MKQWCRWPQELIEQRRRMIANYLSFVWSFLLLPQRGVVFLLVHKHSFFPILIEGQSSCQTFKIMWTIVWLLDCLVNYSLMAASAGESQGVERLLSYAEDLVAVLCVSTDCDDNAQVGAGVQRLLSACRSESDDLEMQLKGQLVPCSAGIYFTPFRRLRCFSYCWYRLLSGWDKGIWTSNLFRLNYMKGH
jgi:hypothetical protein